MADLQKLVEELSSLTVMEAAELKKMLEEAWGVEAAAPMAMGAMPMMAAGAALTVLHALIAFTPLYYVVVRGLLGAPEEIVEPARIGLQIFLPWTWTIAYRRFNQGVMIRFGHSRWVGAGTVVRLTAGLSVLAAGLVILSQVQGPLAYLAAWAFLGIGMRMTLYDAAFPSLVQVMPSQGRRAISFLTLYGGFASSVFWPIGHALNGAYGWRTTLIGFALVNLCLTLPLTLFALSWREDAPAAAATDAATAGASAAAEPLEGGARLIAMTLFGIVAALGLAALIFTSGYALQQLRVGGPLYSQIKLGNDLIADILPPPAYVLEAYLEATLALREPGPVAVVRRSVTLGPKTGVRMAMVGARPIS